MHCEQLAQGKGTHETFDYTPFSDAGLLSELIRNRIKLDVTYNEKVFSEGVLASNGGLVFNECILATYISLDALIAAAKLTDKQLAVINLLMRG